tara:strand:+ start:285 stop:695 length:411 start_codon:yes stop_codon:yes gene_type:complete
MRVETISGTTKTILPAESGELYIVKATGGLAVTLPAAKAGAYLKFLFGDDTGTGGNITFTAASTSEYIVGFINTLVASGAVTQGGQALAGTGDVMTIADGAGIKEGSWVEFVSDGTQWYVSGIIVGADVAAVVSIA